ncbi:HD domain-containing protein, partial [Candidatus Gracilibacteria bacterium]|nr:HD domain-containing protein [Candidatus Gracilibacteria bacterium]
VLDNTPATLHVRLAALLHDVAKPVTFSLDEKGEGHFFNHNIVGEQMARAILNRLKFSNDTVVAVTRLIKEHTSRYARISTSGLKRLIKRVGVENINDLFELQLADVRGSANPSGAGAVDRMREEANSILSSKEPLGVKDLAISGRDLIDMGFQPGPEMGKIIKDLLELVLEKPELNNRENLINLLRKRNK